MNWLVLVVCGLVWPQLLSAHDQPEIAVRVDREFFNPSIGQKLKITLSDGPLEALRVEIFDRDGYTIRSLEIDSSEKGSSLAWDGRDQSGSIVPDEAYSLRIRLLRSGTVVYDPAAHLESGAKDVVGVAYARQAGTLTYSLERPSRVHIQAGQARKANADSPMDGPVLTTVVDEKPRAGGRIVENWSGWDEKRIVYIPDLPHFVVSIVASELPENTLIAVGNRKEDFLSYARRTRGDELRPRELASGSHERHRALRSFEDHSPSLDLNRVPATDAETWLVDKSEDLALTAAIDPFAAEFFLSGDTELVVYMGLTRVQSESCDVNPCTIRIPASRLVVGSSLLAVNWASGFGPVAVATRRVEVR